MAFIDALAEHTEVPETLLTIIPWRLFMLAGRQAVDGNLGRISARGLARMVAPEFEISPDALFRALTDPECGFLEIDQETDELHVHDWEDYGGQVLEKRKEDADRKAAWRQSRGEKELSRNCPGDNSGTSEGRPRMSPLEGEGEGEGEYIKAASSSNATTVAEPTRAKPAAGCDPTNELAVPEVKPPSALPMTRGDPFRAAPRAGELTLREALEESMNAGMPAPPARERSRLAQLCPLSRELLWQAARETLASCEDTHSRARWRYALAKLEDPDYARGPPAIGLQTRNVLQAVRLVERRRATAGAG